MEDPVLELYGADGVRIAANDNWRDTQQQEIEQTGVPPIHDKEAAIVQTLDAGLYTGVLSGKDNTTGVALIEVFDLDRDSGARLANISTRGFVSTGDDVMIGGFIVGPEIRQQRRRASADSSDRTDLERLSHQ